jgi:hypothetical protein
MVVFNVGLVLWLLVPLYDGSTASGRHAIHATWFGWFVLFPPPGRPHLSCKT